VVAWHQLVRWQHHKHQAEARHGARVELLAPRGRMYDGLGRPLTLNRSICSIRILPQYATCRDTLAAILARFGLGDERTNRAELRRRKRHFWFRRNVDVGLADSLRKVLVKRKYHNCTLVDDDEERLYPYHDVCAPFTGFVGGEARGLAGLESEFDSIMRGRPGWKLLQKDALGNNHPYPSYPTVEPVPGADVHLTIDLDVQEVCYAALAERVRATRALKGSVMVIEAGTGRILGLADYPSYDPQAPGNGSSERHKCTAVSDVFEPGSVFKLVTAATALESPDAARLTAQQFDVRKGFITIGKYKIGDAHVHGICSFDSLLIMSSNPGCALLSFQLDRERFYETARGLGFGSAVGIGLPGEGAGGIDKPARLNTLRLANISFGQGLTATLVQLAAAYLCVANDGVYLKPYLIDSVCRQGVTLQRNSPVRVRRALSPATAGRLKDIFARVISEGTGLPAAIPGVVACGKTGTAQKTEPGGGYSKTRSRMSFIGFFPKEQPRYVVAVLVDEPTTDRFASTVAGPVFSEIGQKLLRLERMRRAREVLQLASGG
jgi:cell division protein FtsI (penicillin-binding protein 3)